MTSDERIVQSILKFGCLYLAVEMCRTASAFDRPERVMELSKQFECYCTGEQQPVDPGRQVPGDPPPDPPARKLSKKDMERFLR